MIFDINDLSHVFHIISYSLSSLAVSLTAWSERANAVGQVLVFRSGALQWVEVELVLG